MNKTNADLESWVAYKECKTFSDSSCSIITESKYNCYQMQGKYLMIFSKSFIYALIKK